MSGSDNLEPLFIFKKVSQSELSIILVEANAAYTCIGFCFYFFRRKPQFYNPKELHQFLIASLSVLDIVLWSKSVAF